jgi:hypothetical protein
MRQQDQGLLEYTEEIRQWLKQSLGLVLREPEVMITENSVVVVK